MTVLALPSVETLDVVVRRHCELVIGLTGGNLTRAARLLGVGRATLFRWRKRWEAWPS